MKGIILLIVLFAIIYIIYNQYAKIRLRKTLKKIKGLKITDKYLAFDNKSIIAIDIENRKLVYVNRKYKPYFIEFENIVNYDFNYETVEKTKGSISAALTGQAIAGAKGFFGAYIASLETYNKIKRMDLIIQVNDENIKYLEVNLINSPVKVDGIIMKSVKEKMSKWEDYFIDIINSN